MAEAHHTNSLTQPSTLSQTHDTRDTHTQAHINTHTETQTIRTRAISSKNGIDHCAHTASTRTTTSIVRTKSGTILCRRLSTFSFYRRSLVATHPPSLTSEHSSIAFRHLPRSNKVKIPAIMTDLAAVVAAAAGSRGIGINGNLVSVCICICMHGSCAQPYRIVQRRCLLPTQLSNLCECLGRHFFLTNHHYDWHYLVRHVLVASLIVMSIVAMAPAG